MTVENWRPVVGFEMVYEVSDLYRIRRVVAARGVVAGHILKPYRGGKGYLAIRLYVNGRRRAFKVHHLVLLAFVGPRPEGMECRHLDGNKTNNRPENLCWGTRTENMADKLRHGTMARGERNGQARLTETNVIEIRKLLAQGMPQQAIASRFGVSRRTIVYIKSGARWTHVVCDTSDGSSDGRCVND